MTGCFSLPVGHQNFNCRLPARAPGHRPVRGVTGGHRQAQGLKAQTSKGVIGGHIPARGLARGHSPARDVTRVTAQPGASQGAGTDKPGALLGT